MTWGVDGIFGGLARLRGGKPIHKPGRVYDARLLRRGGGTWGVPWLDEPGEDTGVVRLSRGAGLPRPLPDVLGLAFGFTTAGGARHDLLLSTGGTGRFTRHLLVPRRDPLRSEYSTLFPYRSGDLRVTITARPRPVCRGGPLFLLHAAVPGGTARELGLLVLDAARGDEPIAFDPVLHPLPGLTLPGPIAALRAGAYRGARAARGRALDEVPVSAPTPPLTLR
ncbi:hypothetical protein [Catenuloplanes atrovinosus]|uniref:Phosphodiesterase n=1 Tax=Catenuloplanes atrovinosus TaxID=137266 RepID=A0AAE4CCU7_9ACTN|nr:hypothetical protein [Catenuloplanes atrovinosus]MDR7276885.1 hypothetical protein [Catenuloplanes atrovinosus]